MKSAGILVYRFASGTLEVLLVHPGGPFWSKKDAGAWMIPKGEINESEDPLAAARRELEEETGLVVDGPFMPLAPIKQRGGKTVIAWAAEGDCDPAAITSNSFSMEWPPRSGKFEDFPEVDKAAWYTLPEARAKMLPSQMPLLDALEQKLR